jgi:hypothetical protein
MKGLVAVAVAALTISTAVLKAEDIVIEARAEGQNYDRYKETAGKWTDSNNPPLTAKSGAPGLTPQGKCGSRKFPLGPGGGDANQILASARFTPKVSKAGHYYVYVTFPKASNATPVKYLVKHAKGQETKSIAQDGWGAVGSPNASVWVGLGDYDFGPSDDQYVEMQVGADAGAPDPRTPGQAFADGMRFSTDQISDSKQASSGPAATPKAGDAAVASTPAGAPAPAEPGAARPTDVQLSWLEDIRSAQDIAGKSGKKIFVFFYSPESERSNNYDRKVFNDPKVKQVLKDGYVLVRVNIDENRSLANNLQVFRAGTINIYDDRGNGINQFTETMDAEELSSKLK